MANEQDPESLDNINSFEITQEIKDLINNLKSDIEDEKTKKAWWDQAIDNFINLRYGIRNSKVFPWAGCANYVIPLIDSDMNRIKPAYASLIDVYPVVIFEPFGITDANSAKKREVYFDWLLKAKMNFFENYMLGIDYLLEQGIVVWKITWKYTTRTYTEQVDLKEIDEQSLAALYDPRLPNDVLKKIFIEEFQVDESFQENMEEIDKAIEKFRAGKTSFELTLQECKEDQPEITPCSLRYDLVVPVETTDINDARFIDYRFQVSRNDLKIAMRDGKYEKFPDNEIEAWTTGFMGDGKNRQRIKTILSAPTFFGVVNEI